MISDERVLDICNQVRVAIRWRHHMPLQIVSEHHICYREDLISCLLIKKGAVLDRDSFMIIESLYKTRQINKSVSFWFSIRDKNYCVIVIITLSNSPLNLNGPL